MYRLLAVTLAIMGLTVRMSAGFESLAPCEPILCGCEPAPVAVCCEPASEPMPAPPHRPQAPTPAQQRPAPEPLPPAAETPATEPSAPETPLPADAPPLEPAPEDQQPEPTEPAEPMPFEELFSDESAEEPSSTDEQPPAESAPAERESAPAEREPAPADDDARQPANGEDGPAAAPEADGPAAEDLFTPTGALREPGGWNSDTARAWTDAGGRVLHSARLSGANAEHVTLVDGDGSTHTLRYAELSDGDLRFLRRQIEARRALLAPLANKLLAKEGR